MNDSPHQTNVQPMPAIDGVTVSFNGLNYLRPELLLDFVSISPSPLLAVTPVALLYSSVSVLQQVDLRKLPVEVCGRVVYPISSLKLPALRENSSSTPSHGDSSFWKAWWRYLRKITFMVCRSWVWRWNSRLHSLPDLTRVTKPSLFTG